MIKNVATILTMMHGNHDMRNADDTGGDSHANRKDHGKTMINMAFMIMTMPLILERRSAQWYSR